MGVMIMMRLSIVTISILLCILSSSEASLYQWGRSDIPVWMRDLRNIRLKKHVQDIEALDPEDSSTETTDDDEEEDLVSQVLMKMIIKQMQNPYRILKRSGGGNQFKRMYNVEMLRKLSGGLFDMSYINNNQVRRRQNS